MLTNDGRKLRGRPRAYDPDKALTQARDAFWRNGFSATSLDDLSEATGMNRPSLYGAFGDKAALYLATLARYRADAVAAMRAHLHPSRPLRESLADVYAGALSLYFPAKQPAQGCFLIGTAATEAPRDAEIRKMLSDSLGDFDCCFAVRFEEARHQDEIASDSDPAMLAKIASAILHTLAVRSRAGDRRKDLEAIAEAGINLICGSTPKKRRR